MRACVDGLAYEWKCMYWYCVYIWFGWQAFYTGVKCRHNQNAYLRSSITTHECKPHPKQLSIFSIPGICHMREESLSRTRAIDTFFAPFGRPCVYFPSANLITIKRKWTHTHRITSTNRTCGDETTNRCIRNEKKIYMEEYERSDPEQNEKKNHNDFCSVYITSSARFLFFFN